MPGWTIAEPKGPDQVQPGRQLPHRKGEDLSYRLCRQRDLETIAVTS